VIDLSERAMRYFDETLLVGLVPDVKLTPLPDGDWTPGPIASDPSETYRCELRDAGRDNGAKRLSSLESSEAQTERHQPLDAPSRSDQDRAAAPSPRISGSDELDKGRTLRAGKNHQRVADRSEERPRSSRRAVRLGAETFYMEEAGE
jgi:hypothetical protein